MDDGKVGHCELAVDGARWMMSDEFESAGVAAPDPSRGSDVGLHLTVTDCDAVAAGVVENGVTLLRDPRTARPRAGSRCSATRSAIAGSSTSHWRARAHGRGCQSPPGGFGTLRGSKIHQGGSS